ncbi:MAG: hypothetical protein FWF23_00640 [Alphaproteobacteria bacterium]|nr:hypothetical protein [Alphaproteobacteria bacterium]MCL2505775.1 hypothetical protein [Alphaproteobacteria bacterium]
MTNLITNPKNDNPITNYLMVFYIPLCDNAAAEKEAFKHADELHIASLQKTFALTHWKLEAALTAAQVSGDETELRRMELLSYKYRNFVIDVANKRPDDDLTVAIDRTLKFKDDAKDALHDFLYPSFKNRVNRLFQKVF